MSEVEEKQALLIVEDDQTALRQLRWTFDDFEVATAVNRAQALALIRKTRFPVVLLDLGLPPDAGGASEGLATLRSILEQLPETKVIVVTGREGRQYALKAIELGAHDFFRKPVDADEIRLLVKRAFLLHELGEENRRLTQADSQENFPGVIGTSEAMQALCQLIERAAASDMSILFCGESGTGKDLLAKALHELSARRDAPFSAINCAAIPEQLLESELFGHERGAFTGAVRTKKGIFELAANGTLLLDEIGDMPLALQAKLLRVLEERVMQRVGGHVDIPLDARVVCATHRDLPAWIAEGKFREDLYYRINQLTIEIPPLRERPDDIVMLARHFFARALDEENTKAKGLASDAIAAIVSYAWPGNVRELENCVKRAMVMTNGSWISASDLNLPSAVAASEKPQSLEETRRQAENAAVVHAWAKADGNVSSFSALLGVSRPTAYKMLRNHGLID